MTGKRSAVSAAEHRADALGYFQTRRLEIVIGFRKRSSNADSSKSGDVPLSLSSFRCALGGVESQRWILVMQDHQGRLLQAELGSQGGLKIQDLAMSV